MPIDLSAVSAGDRAPLIHPRDVYAGITKRPWKFLRQEQGEVLEGWFLDRHNKDVVIKQNTGGGKTAVGLLIAQSSLNEGVGPALYLVPDTYLIEQVREEAAKLEIVTVLEPEDPRFVAGEAVLVGTLQKLVNGISKFGVSGSGRPVVEVGTIVIDDAHAALASVESQFALQVDSGHPFYQKLLTVFLTDIEEQSPSRAREIREGDFTALQRVPFWAWRSKEGLVLDAVRPHLDEQEFKFAWPLIKDQLSLCAAIFTGKQLDIRPPAPPIHKIPSFGGAARRIYMTATLVDDAVLTQDLGVDPAYIKKAITPARASDIGNRVILAPLELDPSLSADSIRVFAHNYATGWKNSKGVPTRDPINVVVLVPSDRAAKAWAPYADEVWNVDQMKVGVPRLRVGHVGLVVLANKYDGIDLPDDACRLLVIDGLPVTLDSAERREASAMVKSPRVLARQVQHVEQGMGRGIRDGSDYCAVLLMGTALTRVVHDPKQRALFSPATLKQLDLSRSLSSQLTGGLADVREAIELCLSQDTAWLRKDRAALAGTSYRADGAIRDSVVASRRAFDKAVAQDFSAAEKILNAAANAASDSTEKGWLFEQQAVYLDVIDANSAQKVLLKALMFNHHVLHPVKAASLPKVRALMQQSEAVGAYFTAKFSDSLDANLGIRELFDRLVWDEAHTREAEAMWAELGELLGFGSERPDLKYKTGPDNLWATAGGVDVVFELKTGALFQPVSKGDVDQFGGHVRWYEKEFGATPKAFLVHPSAEYDSKGTMPKGARVITPDDVSRLREALLSLSTALPSARWTDATSVASALTARNLSEDRLFDTYSTKPRVSLRAL